MAESLFALEHVSFAYAVLPGGAEISCAADNGLLRDVSFSLEEGAQVGLYGANGCGKTTLFRLTVGLIRPQQGRLLLHGRPVETDKDVRDLRKAVGLVLQNADDQLFCPTVLEDVAFGPLNLGLTPAEARERAMETLASLGLAGFENRLTHRLSCGEKKLVSLATVLAMRPEVLLLDEPTNGLDPDARERLVSILRGLTAARIIISHDWDFLERTCSEYLTIEDGRLSASSPSLPHSHIHAHPLGNRPHEHFTV